MPLYFFSIVLIHSLFVQIVPLHLPPGDTSAERSVYINGGTEQIEAAKELVNEVISGVSHHGYLFCNSNFFYCFPFSSIMII